MPRVYIVDDRKTISMNFIFDPSIRFTMLNSVLNAVAKSVAGLRVKLRSTPTCHAASTFTRVECGICEILEIARDIHRRWLTERTTR